MSDKAIYVHTPDGSKPPRRLTLGEAAQRMTMMHKDIRRLMGEVAQLTKERDEAIERARLAEAERDEVIARVPMLQTIDTIPAPPPTEEDGTAFE